MSKKKKAAPAKTGSKKPVKKPNRPAGGAGMKSASKSARKPAKTAVKKAANKPVTKASKAPVKKSSNSAKSSGKTLGKKIVKAVAKNLLKSAAKKAIVSTITRKLFPKAKTTSSSKNAGKNTKSSAPKSSVSSKSSGSKPQNKSAGNLKTAVKSAIADKIKQVIAPKASPAPVANNSHKNNNKPSSVAPAAASKTAPAPAPKKSAEPVSAPKKAEEPVKKGSGEKKTQDVLAITNTIPTVRKNEISPSKIASISHSITNPVRRTDSYAVKPEKEPSGKFEMEFVVHSSAEMLYEFLSTPSGLSEWFCDDLNIRNGIYTFIWDDQLQQARLLKTVDQQLVRFQWCDKTDGSYFEFKIQRDDLTNDIALIITDFADTPSERESSKLLWHSQIEKLMHVIGSIF